VAKCGRAGQATGDQYNPANALYVLDNEGSKHTPRICNAYSFSTTTSHTHLPES